jgi:hypothetical protein
MEEKVEISFASIKEKYKAMPIGRIVRNISLLEEVEHRCYEMDQITSNRFNFYGRQEPDLYYLRDRVKIRLKELQILRNGGRDQ